MEPLQSELLMNMTMLLCLAVAKLSIGRIVTLNPILSLISQLRVLTFILPCLTGVTIIGLVLLWLRLM